MILIGEKEEKGWVHARAAASPACDALPARRAASPARGEPSARSSACTPAGRSCAGCRAGDSSDSPGSGGAGRVPGELDVAVLVERGGPPGAGRAQEAQAVALVQAAQAAGRGGHRVNDAAATRGRLQHQHADHRRRRAGRRLAELELQELNRQPDGRSHQRTPVTA